VNKLKILCITPENPYIVTPETGFAHDLTKLGHDVTIMFATNKYSDKVLQEKFDIVFGQMEYSMKLANFIGNKLNIPVYNHMEWVPPWRVGQESPEKWGYEETSAEKVSSEKIEYFKRLYSNQVEEWENATIRSCAGKCLIKTIEPFATKPIECEIKYYAPNIDKLEKYRDSNIKEKNQIMSTARLVPHKRIIHIIRALGMIPNDIRPKYVLVGYGNEIHNIINEANKLGVDIETIGSGDKGVKERVIQESMFSVNIWAGIPIAESFYFKKPAISYKEEHMYEVLGDSVLYAEPNNIQDLADKITYFIKNPEERKAWGEQGYRLMMTDQIGMGTPLKLAKQVESILYKGIEIFKKK
jgi:glycosyltransferase involved in cell wall biosynthesis